MRKNLYLLLSAVFLFGLSFQLQAQQNYIITVAGTGTAVEAGDGSPAVIASLNNPAGIAFDASGNMYVADYAGCVVRKITTAGIISTFAGNGILGFLGDGGAALSAELSGPTKMAFDNLGNLYIADQNNNRIRKVSPTGSMITTVAGGGTSGLGDGGAATAATLFHPSSVRFDNSGNMYIADYSNYRVRMVSGSGIISTVAGNGTGGSSGDGGAATVAEIFHTWDIAIDASGNLYLADAGNNKIRKVNTAGIISTFAGTGTSGFSGDGGQATAALLSNPPGVSLDNTGSVIVADQYNSRIRKISSSGIITTIAGNGTAGYNGDGLLATATELNLTNETAYDASYHLFICDNDNNRIREMVPDFAPKFTGGESQTMTVCENSSFDTVNSHLVVRDSDVGQTETWTVLTFPTNGTIYPTDSILYTTTSTGGTLTIPSTTSPIAYTPNTGFTGTDSFYIKVFDGITYDSTKIVVTVSAAPSAITGTLHVCAGATTTLSDATTGGVWTSGSTSVATVGSASGIVTGATAGIVDIIYTTACGSVSATDTVTASPAAITPTTGVSICGGSSVTLNETSTGGTWSSGNTLAATVIASGTSGFVFGNANGTATISYTATSGCAATKVVTVQSLSAITPNQPTVCIGGTLTLTDAVTGGTWLSTNTSIATVTSSGGGAVGGSGSSTVTGVSVGVVIIAYTVNTCIAYDTVTVNSGAGAVTSSSTLTCTGSVITLADTATGGVWSSGSTAVATVDGTGDVTGVSGGTAIISYSAGSCYATEVITVAPSVQLTPTTSSLCIGSIETFTEPALSGTLTGVWSNNDPSVATMNVGVVTAVGVGTDIINYTIYDGASPLCLYPATVNVTPAQVLLPVSGSELLLRQHYHPGRYGHRRRMEQQQYSQSYGNLRRLGYGRVGRYSYDLLYRRQLLCY